MFFKLAFAQDTDQEGDQPVADFNLRVVNTSLPAVDGAYLSLNDKDELIVVQNSENNNEHRFIGQWVESKAWLVDSWNYIAIDDTHRLFLSRMGYNKWNETDGLFAWNVTHPDFYVVPVDGDYAVYTGRMDTLSVLVYYPCQLQVVFKQDAASFEESNITSFSPPLASITSNSSSSLTGSASLPASSFSGSYSLSHTLSIIHFLPTILSIILVLF